VNSRLFLSKEKRTPAYEKAVEALEALREEDPDLMTRAYAEVSCGYIKGLYTSRTSRRGLNLKKSPSRNTFDRLIGRRTNYGYDPLWSRWMDHPSLWLKDGRPYSFVGQPYGISEEDMREIIAYCDEYNLQSWVDTGWSWWFPGETLLIELRHKE